MLWDSRRYRTPRPQAPLQKTAHQIAETLNANNFNLELEWEQEGHTSVSSSILNTLQINQPPPGFTLPRETWTSLNREANNPPSSIRPRKQTLPLHHRRFPESHPNGYKLDSKFRY
ncbi:hypothetical protein JTB14_021320 [Gonioctena quinquepunctata]|nr:hypothetical protein JTB14_021320 [Gonioctena quinquepunctata]